jgi:flagellar basal-body rod modification protein FlgD
MSMSGKLQSRIAPVMTNGTRTYNPEETAAPKDKAADQVEFHKLLQNSNSDVTRERMAKKSGDLSSAKTDEEFRKMLSDKSNPQRAPKNTLGKDDFMKLFIAQMQAQDPLNPQDATQMSAQMAQFNSLEQMMNLNKSLDTMIKGQSTDRAVSMVNYVGKEVDIGNGLLKWDKNKLTKSTFEIDQPLANATVEVRDGSGQIVSQEDLGNLMPGEHNVKWTGKMKDGNTANSGIYNFAIIAKTTDGQEVAVPIKTKVKVTGIDMQAEGGAFFTEVGKIDIKDIASVGLQGFDEAKTALNTLEKTPIKEAGNEITEGKNEDTEGDPKGENQAISTNPELLAKPASEGTMESPEGNSQEAAEPSDLIADTDKRAGSPTIKSPIEIPVNVSEL